MKKLINSISYLTQSIQWDDIKFDNLTYEQLNIFYNIIKFVRNSDDLFFVLDANAGTGKTYILTSVVKYFLNINYSKIIISAPTHKALYVIKEMIINKNIDINSLDFKTIHKLIRARAIYTDQGRLEYNIDISNTSFKEKNVLCFIDESGMIDENCFEGLIKWITKVKGKIIFCVDTKQLPPINENYSKVSKLKNIYTLKKIHRIQTMGLYKVYSTFAYFVDKKYFDREMFNRLINNKNNNITLISKGKIEEILKLYINRKNEIKFLCFRNTSRKEWNLRIRKVFYPTIKQKLTIGEQLVANTTFYYDDRQIHSSQFFEVKDLIIREKECCGMYFLCYIINNLEKNELSIIHEKSGNQFKSLKTTLKENTIYNIEYKGLNAGKEWERYYRQINYIDCPLDYSYAITVHKSQGSTFNTVVIDFYDILNAENNNGFVMKMLYTAVSRASHHIYLID
jgi:exodeoxyribonuclease-5